MSSLFGKSALKPTTPTVRKEARSTSQPPKTRKISPLPPSRSSSALQLSKPKPKAPPVDRYKLTPTIRASKDHTSFARQSQKRKSASPAIHMSSASEGESDVPELQPQQKKPKVNQVLNDPKRHIRDVQQIEAGGAEPLRIIHSVDLTMDIYARDYSPMFEDESAEITLRYPSVAGAKVQERFRLARPIKSSSDDHDPPSDLVETIRTILHFYLPSNQSIVLLDESSGIPFRLSRAFKHQDLTNIRAIVTEFNEIIEKGISDGSVSMALDALDHLPKELIQRILNQVYARTVSPAISTLSSYKAASDNVYGELQYPFCSQIFRDASLNSSSVFLDLGSGVGNVVLQASLEIGCESWGIEIMPKACALAEPQASEFRARARLWGLNVGSVSLLEGDFFTDQRLDTVLRRADVVLVNNQAFQPETNSALVNKFLEMKDGARLVSLKNFASGYQLRDNTQNNPVAVWDVKENEFFHDWVSWTHAMGRYYVATKDPGRIERLLKKQKRRQ